MAVSLADNGRLSTDLRLSSSGQRGRIPGDARDIRFFFKKKITGFFFRSTDRTSNQADLPVYRRRDKNGNGMPMAPGLLARRKQLYQPVDNRTAD